MVLHTEVVMFVDSRPLLKRAAALIRFSFFSKRLHCVKVLLPTSLNPELLIWTLELSSIVGTGYSFFFGGGGGEYH